MGTTVFEGYTVGEIERGIPFQSGSGQRLSVEQKKILQMKDGESLVLVLRFDGFSTDNARRLVHWARLKGIRTRLRRIDDSSVRIWRIGAMACQAVDEQREQR